MLIYSDDLIELTYTPAQRILYAAWREHRSYSAAEVKNAFMAIVASAEEHHVERVLLNFGDNTQDLTEPEYKALLAQLILGLRQSPIKKIVCIGPSASPREQRLADAFDEIKASVGTTLDFRFFSNRADALPWLLSQTHIKEADL